MPPPGRLSVISCNIWHVCWRVNISSWMDLLAGEYQTDPGDDAAHGVWACITVAVFTTEVNHHDLCGLLFRPVDCEVGGSVVPQDLTCTTLRGCRGRAGDEWLSLPLFQVHVCVAGNSGSCRVPLVNKQWTHWHLLIPQRKMFCYLQLVSGVMNQQWQ